MGEKLVAIHGTQPTKDAPSGDVVGTTDAQTLTNKTFTIPTTELTATATFTPRAGIEVLELNHTSTAVEVTIAAPVKGNFLIITNTSASGTAAHTVTLTAGDFDGTNNVATLNAPEETLVVYGVSATRYVIVENIGTVGLS